jgi:hypothetical protein
MAKVIVERPRYGSRDQSLKKGYRKYLQKTRVDELPRNEPMLGRWQGMGKMLNEHLGPMRRFLRSNVGRPWNKIHQELCEHISFNNAVQAHVLEHIYQYVHKHVVYVGTESVIALCWWGGTASLREGEMYVCPKTGLLKAARLKPRQKIVNRIVIGSHTLLLRRDNMWWEVQLRDRPKVVTDLWDVWLEKEVCKLKFVDRLDAFGSEFIAVSKRLLTQSETKQLYRNLRQKKRRK